MQPATNGSVNADEAITVGVGNDKEESGVHDQQKAEEDKMPITVRFRRQVKASCRQCCTVKTLKRKLPILQWLPSCYR